MGEICNSSLGKHIDGDSLQIQRFLPGPIERVWEYLTDSELRSEWLASGSMLPEEGSEFTFTWRNDELDGNPDRGAAAADPDCSADEHSMTCHIVSWEPPTKLAFTWSNSGDVTIELETRGDEVLLTLTHNKLPDQSTVIGVSTGWHAHLDYLIARLSGMQPEPFWENYNRLKAEYEELVAEHA